MSDILGGHRAKVGYIDDTGAATWVGIWSNVNFQYAYDAQVANILGRYGPAAIEYVGMQPVSVTAAGWRVLNHGPFADAKMPKLQDLLNFGSLTMGILDRKNPSIITNQFYGLKPTNLGSGYANRALSELTLNFIGMGMEDESGANSEDATATFLP